MKIIESIDEMREYSQQCKRDGKTIASVDTAGYLHDGHMSLVKIAKENADVVIVSIDTHPEFFNMKNNSDEHYKVVIKDINLCKTHGVDIFFNPSMEDMYGDTITKITLSTPFKDNLPKTPFRDSLIFSFFPYFNIEMPDITVLGQKDIHQTMSVIALINYFKLPIKSIIAPISREPDRVAYSSCNRFLTSLERQNATSIYQTLHEISRWSTYPSVENIKEHFINRINSHNGKVEYIQICCYKTLKELDSINKKFIIIVNINFNEIFLDDNIIIDP